LDTREVGGQVLGYAIDCVFVDAFSPRLLNGNTTAEDRVQLVVGVLWREPRRSPWKCRSKLRVALAGLDQFTSARTWVGTLVHRPAHLCRRQSADFNNEYNSRAGQSRRRWSGGSQHRTASSELEYKLPTGLLYCLEQTLGPRKLRRKLSDRHLQAD
jgi:hypothetical protein